MPSEDYMDGLNNVPGMSDALQNIAELTEPAQAASAIEFVLEGLHLSNKLNREVVEGTMTYKKV